MTVIVTPVIMAIKIIAITATICYNHVINSKSDRNDVFDNDRMDLLSKQFCKCQWISNNDTGIVYL